MRQAASGGLQSAGASDPSAWPHEWPDAVASPGAKLHGVGRAMRRHFWAILLTLVVLNGLAVAVVTRLPPRFTAEAAVLIGPREAQITDMKAVINGLSGDSDVIESEMQVVHSRRLARRVVEQLGLDRNPEFNPALAPPGLRQRVASNLNRLMMLLPSGLRFFQPSGGATAEGGRPDEEARDPLGHTTDALLRHLSVAAKGRSRVIGITVDAADPAVAADAANAVAEAYIDQQLHAKTDATTHAHQWLEEHVAELRQQASNADKAVEAYRQKSGLLSGSSSSLVAEQISNVGQQIIQAQVQKADADARLQTLSAVLASGGSLDGLPEVQNSLLIRDLHEQGTNLLKQAAELAANYGRNYPKVAAIAAQIETVRARERAELQHAADGLRSAASTAAAREALLQPVLAQLRLKAGLSKQGEIELNGLQKEADADHALFERLLSRSKETQIEVGLQQPDGQIISRAEPPDVPSFPNPGLMLPVCFLASCMMAALLVIGLESLDLGFSSMGQLEAVLGVTALGIVPRIARILGQRTVPESYVLSRPDSAYSEAIRSLYTSLLFSKAARPPKIVLVASANAGEGKSTIVLSLGRLIASGGKRVAIVDCDVRRPSLHKALGVPRGPGLIDWLTNDVKLEAILKRDPVSGAWLLPAGSPRINAPDLFASKKMEALIDELRKRFDLVLLDSAPVLTISDTRALARLVDETVFVARWYATRRLQVRKAIRQISDAGGNVAGVLLSMVDLGRYAREGEGGASRRDLRLYLAK